MSPSKVSISQLEKKNLAISFALFSHKKHRNIGAAIVSVALTRVPDSCGSRSSLRTPARRN